MIAQATKSPTARFDKAYLALQKELTNPVPTGHGQLERDGKTVDYVHLELGPLLTAVRPLINRHGLVLLEKCRRDGNTIAFDITLRHVTSGEQEVFEGIPFAVGSHPHDTGTAATMARRYAILAALNLAAEDTDANPAPPSRSAAAPSPDRGAAGGAKRPARPTPGQRARIKSERKSRGITTTKAFEALLEQVGIDPQRAYPLDGPPHEHFTKDDANTLIDWFVAHPAAPAAPETPTQGGGKCEGTTE